MLPPAASSSSNSFQNLATAGHREHGDKTMPLCPLCSLWLNGFEIASRLFPIPNSEQDEQEADGRDSPAEVIDRARLSEEANADNRQSGHQRQSVKLGTTWCYLRF